MSATENMKEYITRKGISQRHIARAAQIDPDKFNRSLNGKRELKVDEYLAACKALEVPADTFTEIKG